MMSSVSLVWMLPDFSILIYTYLPSLMEIHFIILVQKQLEQF